MNIQLKEWEHLRKIRKKQREQIIWEIGIPISGFSVNNN